jgi:copper chaperone CopZ
LLFGLFTFNAGAQITGISLTAGGLTCSMCSKAIYKALLKNQAVEKVDVDIEKASYAVTFKQGAIIKLDEFKKAVQDAGFSLASFRVTANFKNEEVSGGREISLSGNQISFAGLQKQILEGEKTFQVIDKGYLSEKDRKKYDRLNLKEPSQDPGGNIYHVILQQS